MKTEIRVCTNCGTDFEVEIHPIMLCGQCECSIRNKELNSKGIKKINIFLRFGKLFVKYLPLRKIHWPIRLE